MITDFFKEEMHFAGARAIDVIAKRQQQPGHDKMQLKAILKHVEKQKGFVYTTARFAKNKSAILIDIQLHARNRRWQA